MKFPFKLIYLSAIVWSFVFAMTCNPAFSQGLINNGAHIALTPGAVIHVSGGAATGNFLNQDFGAFTGTVSNEGTMEITGDWNNLSAANVFNASTGTVRLTGANQEIQGNTTTYFNNLILTGSGIKTLQVSTLTGGGFAAPAGVLDLTTLPLDLNGFRLTLNNPSLAAVTGTTGYIISETPAAINPSIVQWNMGATNGTYIYPFGVAGTAIPFILDKISGVGNVSVSTRATAAPANLPWEASVTNMYSNIIGGPGEVPVVIDRWWDVDPSSPVTAGMTFTYRGIENTTTYSPTGTFSAQNWNSFQWLPPTGAGPGAVAGTGSVSTPPQLLSSTPWVLANLDAPLPVELLEFSSRCNGTDRVDITWSTASELNNKYFTLEKSSGGNDFEHLATIAGQGNGTHIRHYSYADNKLYHGNTYYRLSQTDDNGKMQMYEPVIQKTCHEDEKLQVHAWHNGPGIHVLVNTPASTSYKISLFDASGRLVYKGNENFSAGVSEFLINTEMYSKGVYFLSLSNTFENLNFKIVAGN